MGNITNERKEQLIEIQNQLTKLNDSIQKIIDGKTSMKEFAEENGITSQQLNYTINNGLYGLMKRIKILNDNDIENLLRESKSAAERLIAVILATDDLIILDLAEEDVINKIMKEKLTEREYEVIKLRYGFNGEPKFLDEVAKDLRVTRERVRQLEIKAIRKLRCPSRLRMLLPNYEIRMQALMETERMSGLEKNLQQKEEAVKNDNTSAKYDVMKMGIDELDLSVRAYNGLRRAGLNTVHDLSKLTVYDFMKIRNLGKISLNEIINKLKEYGVTINSEEGAMIAGGCEVEEVSNLNISSLALSKLHSHHIITIDYLSKLTVSELMQKMDMNYTLTKEVYDELNKKYKIKLVDDCNFEQFSKNNPKKHIFDQHVLFGPAAPITFKNDYFNHISIDVLDLPLAIKVSLRDSNIDTIDKLIKAGPVLSEITKLDEVGINDIRSAIFKRYCGTIEIH